MLKSFSLISIISAASILFVSNMAFSNSLPTGSIYPEVQSPDIAQPVCYMQTPDDRTLDLSRLCEKKPSNQIQLIISDVVREDGFLIANVVNKSNKTVYQTKVNYEVIGKNGSVIERGAIATQPATLSPGQTGIFQTVIPGNTNVRTTFAEGKDEE